MTTSKVILNGSKGTYREVFYNHKGVQTAIVTGTLSVKIPDRYVNEPATYYNLVLNVDQPFFELAEWKVSIPIEGMGGWTLVCNSKSKAIQIANNERSKRGKVINRLFHLPASFLLGNLF